MSTQQLRSVSQAMNDVVDCFGYFSRPFEWSTNDWRAVWTRVYSNGHAIATLALRVYAA